MYVQCEAIVNCDVLNPMGFQPKLQEIPAYGLGLGIRLYKFEM